MKELKRIMTLRLETNNRTIAHIKALEALIKYSVGYFHSRGLKTRVAISHIPFLSRENWKWLRLSYHGAHDLTIAHIKDLEEQNTNNLGCLHSN